MSEVLTKIERQSAVFQKLEAHYRKQLQSLRETNDGSLDEKATAKLRGRIAEVKEFLRLGDDPPRVPVEPLDSVNY